MGLKDRRQASLDFEPAPPDNDEADTDYLVAELGRERARTARARAELSELRSRLEELEKSWRDAARALQFTQRGPVGALAQAHREALEGHAAELGNALRQVELELEVA